MKTSVWMILSLLSSGWVGGNFALAANSTSALFDVINKCVPECTNSCLDQEKQGGDYDACMSSCNDACSAKFDKALADPQADLNAKDKNGEPLLSKVIERAAEGFNYAYRQLFEKLVDDPRLDVNAPKSDPQRWPALLLAAKLEHYGYHAKAGAPLTEKLLVRKGVDVNITAKYDEDNTTGLLLMEAEDCDEKEARAKANNTPYVVRSLSLSGIDVNTIYRNHGDPVSALKLALYSYTREWGCPETVRQLIRAGASKAEFCQYLKIYPRAQSFYQPEAATICGVGGP